MEQKLEQLKALLEELGESEKLNMFVMLDEKHNKTVLSGLCGEIKEIETSLCVAFDNDITAFSIAMRAIMIYAMKHGTLKKHSELYRKMVKVLLNTLIAREVEEELELEQEKENEE